jgi:hypothetical protein
VFGSHLVNIRHVLFLKLLARLFAQRRCVRGTIQQYKEVLRSLCIQLSLRLPESQACKRQTE